MKKTVKATSLQWRSDGGTPQNQSTLQIYVVTGCFQYRASVRLSEISKVKIYTPPHMKFLATPMLV